MSKSINNVRTYNRVTVGVGFQAAKGTAATNMIYVKEADVTPTPGVIEMMPQGTDGQMFHGKQGHRLVYRNTVLNIKGWTSRTTAAIMLEMLTGGKPKSSGAQVAFAANTITSGVLEGIRPYLHCNSIGGSGCKITLSSLSVGSNKFHLRAFYSTQVLASVKSVAKGGAVSMTAQNNSGLTITGTASANLAQGSTVITVKEISHQWAYHPHALAYVTVVYSDGFKKYIYEDCVLGAARFTSGGREGLRFDVNIHAGKYTKDDDNITADVYDNDFLATRDVTMTYDSAGGNLSLGVAGSFTIEGVWDITEMPDNAEYPDYFKRENIQLHTTVEMKPSDETYTILDNADDEDFKALDVDVSYGDYGMGIAFGDVIAEPNTALEASGKEVSTQSIDFRGRSDTAAATPTVADITVTWRA